jgi:hypothetical protein
VYELAPLAVASATARRATADATAATAAATEAAAAPAPAVIGGGASHSGGDGSARDDGHTSQGRGSSDRKPEDGPSPSACGVGGDGEGSLLERRWRIVLASPGDVLDDRAGEAITARHGANTAPVARRTCVPRWGRWGKRRFGPLRSTEV